MERIKCTTFCNVFPIIKYRARELPLYGIICVFKKDLLHKTVQEQLPVLAAARQEYFRAQFLFVLGQVKVRRSTLGKMVKSLKFCCFISSENEYPV